MSNLDLFLAMEEGRPLPRAPKVSEVRTRVALPPSRLPGLDYALNPYVGCQHDCLYCYAPYVTKRPRSEWTNVLARTDLPLALAREIRGKKGVIGLGTVTDPYQEVERHLLITRRCLMEIIPHGLKVSVLTKSDLILRDLELYRELPGEVGLTVTSISDALSREFEPGAPLPQKRLDALRQFSDVGINAYALVGPLLPVLEEKDAAELVDALVDTGIKWIMLDRFRPRPGMYHDIRSRCGGEIVGDRLESAHLGKDYKGLESFIRKRCSEVGLRCVDAF
ncbi:MAG TPA: radical SAM protein [Methanomassiliicoccales archaeon]|nr:radical SAM protein [Methanomassiliicoccales archaeon]